MHNHLVALFDQELAGHQAGARSMIRSRICAPSLTPLSTTWPLNGTPDGRSIRSRRQGHAKGRRIKHIPEGRVGPQARAPCRGGLRGCRCTSRSRGSAARATMAVPTTMSESPTTFPNFCPGMDRVRPPSAGAAGLDGSELFYDETERHDGDRRAMHARNIRSFAAWSP